MLVSLAKKLHLVTGQKGGQFPYSHGLLIDGDAKVLIDTGFGKKSILDVQAHCNVNVIINTHFHSDHVVGNSSFPLAEVWAHGLDAPALYNEEAFLRFSGMGRIREQLDLAKYFPGCLEEREVARELTDLEVLDFGDISLQVIHLPGHTPGHIGFYHPLEGILFSGDIDLSPFGPWYANAQSNLEQYIASIDKVMDLNPNVLVTSHEGIFVNQIKERLTAYRQVFEQREHRILHALSDGKSIEELVDIKLIHGESFQWGSVLYFFEQTMLEKHLEHLISQGVVKLYGGRYCKA